MIRRSWRLTLLALLLAATPAVSAAEIVVNGAIGDPALSRPVLRGMFGMRLRAWPDGTPVRVFVLEDSDPLHQQFCESKLQMYPYQLRQNWDRLLYSGTGQPPIVVRSEDEMLKRVAETPGAIGYVRDYKPSADAKKGKAATAAVKVLNVR